MPYKTNDRFWKNMTPLSLTIFLGAVFFTFATVGFILDMLNLGRLATPTFLIGIFLSGGFATLYALGGTVLRHHQRWLMVVLFLLQFFLFATLGRLFPKQPRPETMDRPAIIAVEQRVLWSGMGCIVSIATGYGLFIWMINREGERFFKLKAEMDLASEIHKQLVPPIAVTAGRFEFFGRSEASGEVGGDLIDVVVTGGANEARWVAYIADVAGHGVAPGVVMGMVKSAARMQLTAAHESAFLDRLNAVLYPLRAPQMFVTFAYVAGAGDGLEYGVAGHPAILHASRGEVRELVSENLPLGILPENRFVTGKAQCAAGDVLLMVTDGLLEVEDKAGNEFGSERLKTLLRENAAKPLAEIAGAITAAVQKHGGRNDDQSLLLVRCKG